MAVLGVGHASARAERGQEIVQGSDAAGRNLGHGRGKAEVLTLHKERDVLLR